MTSRLAVGIVGMAGLLAQEPPPGLLARIKGRVDENLQRLPDYTCVQTIERASRDRPGADYKAVDTLRLEVGLVGQKERFGWLDASQFEDKPLADMVGFGATGTGSFALHAGSVFRPRVADFTYQGEVTHAGRPAYRWDYEVPVERSRYRLRVGGREAVVGFHGSFWVDRETLDLVRLEVQVDEIPSELGLMNSSDKVDYARTALGDAEFILPQSAELIMIDRYQHETRNRTRFGRCRQFTVESRVKFDAETKPETATGANAPASLDLPPRLTLELALDTEITPQTAAIGDPVRAVLERPLKHGERVLAPKGATVLGRITRVEKEAMPFPHYVVALQFHTLQLGASSIGFSATMEDAGPAPGLLRQAKRMDPVFTKRRSPRLDILVREQQRGQGVLHWEARRPHIPKGLRMRWETGPVP